MDFVYASLMGTISGRGVMKVWQGVASGWIGKAAGAGGWGSAALGMATHFAIAILMAAAYAAAAVWLPALYRRWLMFAPLYGLLLYAVMYRVVLPLRFGPRAGAWRGPESLLDVAAHIGVAVAAAYVLSRPAAAR